VNVNVDVNAEGEVFDFAIVGAGVSGLCLALALARGPLADRRILLVDGARDDDMLRTLSFWAAAPTPFEALVKGRYHTLTLYDRQGEQVAITLAEHEYRTLFFADLQRTTKETLAGSPRHLVVDGRAGAIEERGELAQIPVNGRVYRARWVFDSRFRLSDLVVHERRYHALRQYFRGLVIHVERPTFDPAMAVFMDFRSALAPGRAFFYLLPYDPCRALVELVTLDPVDPEPEIARYLREQWGVERFTVEDREAGISPMTEQPFTRREGQRVRRIGIPAGRLKASTGYAVTRILDDSRAIVASLVAHGHPFDAPPDRRGYRVLDAVLLELWDTRSAQIPGIFQTMFRKSPGDRILRFLDERASAGDLLKIVLSLPVLPFLVAALRWLLRRAGLLRPTRALPPPA
jgi:lycopene beta-cyclase